MIRYKTSWLFFGLGLVISLAASCSSKPDIHGTVVGSWRIKRANIHSIHSFRNNGNWVEQERVEGKFSRIIENKEKVEGVWAVEYDKELDKLYVVITPNKKGKDEKKWTLDEPARFEVLNIDKKEMVLQDDGGQILNWARVRSSQSDDDEAAFGVATINPGLLIVNLKKARANDKFRFLCLDMTLSVEEAEGLEYLAIETDPETQVVSYHMHPLVLDAAITYFSSQTYKDVKSLEKVKSVVDEFKKVMTPYFEGRLTEVKVNKVVVTAEKDSMLDFAQKYAETYGVSVPSLEESEVEEAPPES